MTLPDRYWRDGRAVIGGSDLGTILGVNPYATPLDLYRIMRGEAPPVEENDAMRRGKALESWLAFRFAQRHGFLMETPEPAQEPPPELELPWVRYSVDRLVYDTDGRKMVWEGKTSRSSAYWGEPGTDQVPLRHIPQVQLYMHCTRAALCHITLGLTLEMALEVRVIDRDYLVPYERDLCMSMLSRAREFLDCVEAGTPP